MTGNLSHRDAMVLHAIRRLWQRRGIAISESQYTALCLGIKADLYPVISVDHRGQNIFKIDVRGRTVFAVWNSEHDCIRTFLPCLEFSRPHPASKRARALQAATFAA